ncbi:DMSO/TMAO reductase YedYZ, molybdopterin-dependent catalytic subunit [Pseudonocardia ammonioxydans]|uniref:DMSO/TMAO reductase YedYZ, molybdopterin-dependent catalytic subunit n=1 Tax=Pseudonocardia ammonioxydans TaxID=260086 RepID=A0A1I5BCK0_PSUAM|nr:DMSO/TMAO reductase YedYZ, molybdopterin-dependent catalytic subunit [Pseudonocardia ammonioxydans]
MAAAVEMLAIVAAIASGHLVAGFLTPTSSPFFAVGDAVVRLSPRPVVEFAKSAFGTADKPVLLAGIGVLLLAAAVAGGLAARRRPAPGTVLVVVLGVVGVAAVLGAPAVRPAGLAAPVVALLVGVAVQRGLHRRAVEAAADRPTGPPDDRDGPGEEDRDTAPVRRRTVLAGASAAVAVGSLVAGGAGAALASGRGLADSRAALTRRLAAARPSGPGPTVPASATFPGPGTVPFVTPNADFYRIDVALQVPAVPAEDWSLRIHGRVARELTLTMDDLLARPLVERIITMTCVSNPIGGHLVSTAVFTGVELAPLLREAGVDPGADQIVSTSRDGWTAGTPTATVLEPGRGALLAVGMNGEALPAEHGFPARMVVPGLYGYVSATKWVTELELTTFAERSAYWRDRGWAVRAPIKTQCRIDAPAGFARLAAGRVQVGGVAWAQPVGVAAVEVRADDGPWVPAELATEVGPDTWRMWRAELDLGPGSHTLQARATDRRGDTQTGQRADPVPDGATGWPSVLVTVT